MERVINWFRLQNTNRTFIAGGSWRRYNGWNWGKILGLIAVIISLISLFV